MKIVRISERKWREEEMKWWNETQRNEEMSKRNLCEENNQIISNRNRREMKWNEGAAMKAEAVWK